MSRALALALFVPLLTAAGLPHAQGTCGDAYRVVRGDTLYSIARLCGTDVATIARASGLADPTRIEIGQRLDTNVAPLRRPVMRHPAPAEPAPEADKVEPARGDGGPVYRMAPGDTLYSLARWARVRMPALLAANPGVDPRRIEIGDSIRLPAGARDPELARQRERGRTAAPPPPQALPRRREAPPPAPPEPEDDDKPDDDGSEPEPAGM